MEKRSDDVKLIETSKPVKSFLKKENPKKVQRGYGGERCVPGCFRFSVVRFSTIFFFSLVFFSRFCCDPLGWAVFIFRFYSFFLVPSGSLGGAQSRWPGPLAANEMPAIQTHTHTHTGGVGQGRAGQGRAGQELNLPK